jgi:FKBP-type peptidyl-prolyl cis-trans isomerase 2
MKHPVCGLALLSHAVTAASAAAVAEDATVHDGMKVTLEYTLTLPDKTVASTNVGGEGESYVHGREQMVPAIEIELAGMQVGEKKPIEVKAADAYGPYDEKAKVTVPRDKVPAEVKVGMQLESADGSEVKVLEVNDKTVVLDTNHPLAGKDLAFDVKILKVEKAEEGPPTDAGAAPAPKPAPQPEAPPAQAPEKK